MKIKDFPIMYVYWCENVNKVGDIYQLTIREWKLRYNIIGTFKIQAKNKNELITIILHGININNNPNYSKEQIKKAKSKITKLT